jgi:phage tail tape-measure protein
MRAVTLEGSKRRSARRTPHEERLTMNAKRQKQGKSSKASTKRHEHEAEGGVAGALAGATLGAIAGPPGAVVGAVIGGVVGALAAGAADSDSADRVAENSKLDAAIGVSGGELGAPNLKHPPAKSGAYSSASTGTGSSTDSSPAEGPIPPGDS